MGNRGKRISDTTVRNIIKRIAAKAGYSKPIYPHKFRITNITMMCEAGLSINEIQVQSGHSNLKTLLEYIQHSPQRIRQSYEKVFEDTPKIQPKTTENEKVDTDYYKRIAVQKYLDGEINEDMLHSMLDGLKDTKQEIRKNRDISYL